MGLMHLFGPVTRFQACPPTCGAAAAVLVSPAFAAKHNLASVEIVAQSLTEPRRVEVEKGFLKFFAKATGETDPVYYDDNAAGASSSTT